jgi:adenylylsulfate kinase
VKKINRNYGILFWCTGLAGSGKTMLSKSIKNEIIKRYGPTVVISGDEIRKIFNWNGYSYTERLKVVMNYCKLGKLLTNQKMNVIFAVIGMMDRPRNWNRKNIRNYIEIFIKAEFKSLETRNKKKLYSGFNKEVVGKSIKAEFPKNPHITIRNNFTKTKKELTKELIKKIEKLLN